MQIFHLTTAFLIMVVLCSQPTSLSAVTVIYSREPVTKTEGLSLSLKCTVRYKIQDCDIQTNWWHWNIDEPLQITDPNKYLITVNETEIDEHRLRNIFLTFSSLKLQDGGRYQCDAKCLDSGTAAKGHLLVLNVTVDPYKDLKLSTWSGQLNADAAVLAFSATLLLLWCY
uniref:Zgc:174945 n=1 Tax=Sinocyclocheilus anshuiensis TaxID=1608454 RepID=A0A671LEI8_9TELE